MNSQKLNNQENQLSVVAEVVQLVQPQEALDEMAEIEKKYVELLERENK